MSQIQKFKSILEGWRNMITRPEQFIRIAEQRAEICLQCEENITMPIGEWCKRCYCEIDAKTWSPKEECPLGKWNKAIDEKGNIIG